MNEPTAEWYRLGQVAAMKVANDELPDWLLVMRAAGLAKHGRTHWTLTRAGQRKLWEYALEAYACAEALEAEVSHD